MVSLSPSPSLPHPSISANSNPILLLHHHSHKNNQTFHQFLNFPLLLPLRSSGITALAAAKLVPFLSARTGISRPPRASREDGAVESYALISTSTTTSSDDVGSGGVGAKPADSMSTGIKEQFYEVIEVKPDGIMSIKNISRRHLLKSSGLRLRDIRSVDPSLWLMNSMPSLLVRDQAILLNLGSLRAIVMKDRVLIFDYNRRGSKAFLKTLSPRLNPKNLNGSSTMQFELEVVEAALISQIQRLEHRLMDIEPRVTALLEVLPNRLTADVLEKLRLSKQTLVELGSRAGALKQMLLDLLDDPHEIRRMCIIGRHCTIHRGNNDMECVLSSEKQFVEEEEEEIEMLLENYLQSGEE